MNENDNKDLVVNDCLNEQSTEPVQENACNDQLEVKVEEEKEKKKKRKYLLPIIASLVTVLVLSGISFAYYRAKLTETNKTETKITTNQLGLIYTGIEDIDVSNAIPGDKFVKTFTVENRSNKQVYFNLHMIAASNAANNKIKNEFNSDLKYKIEVVEDLNSGINTVKSTLVDTTALPADGLEKSYLKTCIPINPGAIISYKMTIEFEYNEGNQNVNQGKEFSGRVGIDVDNITQCSDNNYIVDPTGPRTFTSDADYSLFEDIGTARGEVYVDDERVDYDDYESHPGSTIIVFTPEYWATLDTSYQHTLKLVFNNGKEAETPFYLDSSSGSGSGSGSYYSGSGSGSGSGYYNSGSGSGSGSGYYNSGSGSGSGW